MLDIKLTAADKFWSVDKAAFKPVFRELGRDVVKNAKKFAVSGGDFPKKDKGALRNAIKARVGSRGGYVVVKQKTPKDAKAFYPAFVMYGHGKTKKGTKSWVGAAYDSNLGNAQRRISEVLRRVVV